MTTPNPRYLGKTPKRTDCRTIQLADHTTTSLPTAPPVCRWDKRVPTWGIAGNDRYGNCVIATAAHEILNWRASELSDTRPITDAAVIDLSRTMGALNGYNILDRLNYWRKYQMWAHAIWAYGEIHPENLNLIKTAIAIFGAADIGLQLPNAWRDADVWDTGTGFAYRPGSWGGHSVPLVAYDTTNLFAVSWGKLNPITPRAIARYCDEAYAIISADWLAKNGTNPIGFNLKTLQASLAAATAT